MNRFRTLVAGTAAAIAMTLLIASPAAAHDSIISSDPEPGATLDTAPTQITLTYNADIIELGAAVELVPMVDGAAGAPIELGEPVVDGPVATTEIIGALPPAAYEARWRVVSSDGHPIEGVIAFTVDGPVVETPTEAPSTEASPSASATASAAPVPSVSDAPENAEPSTEAGDGGGSMLPIVLIGGGVVLALAGAVAAVVLLRRRGSGDVR